jgi:glycosyltransferase involved in cell wall biosynthesis
MNPTLLHVVIPAYGESRYLRETLTSAVKFLPPEIPITVIEDPSGKKNLKRLVEDFPRVEYILNEKRLGISGNFTKALKISRGIFTQICGSDDIFINNPLKFIEQSSLDLEKVAAVAFNVLVINDKGKKIISIPDVVKRILRPKFLKSKIFINKKIFENLMLGDWLYFPAIIWRTKTVTLYEFSGEFHTAMDLDILTRLLGEDNQIAFINGKILGYRRHSQSASSLYAKSTGRFDEEFLCHQNALEIARRKNWKTGAFLAQLALTVRLHAIMQSFLMVFTSPLSALKVLVKAISPIR